MKFIKGNVYFCLHDMIIKKELAFKRGKFYTCSKDDALIAENNVEQYMDDNTRWEYYFTPKGNNKNLDNVNHPPHYTWLKDKCGIEVIDITRHIDFCLGNAIKYVFRAGHKQDASMTDKQKEIEDLKKAIFYINDRIKTLEKE